MKVESAYIPRPHVLDFHSRSHRFAILVMHRRAGKTVACINDIIDKALQCPLHAPRYGYIAPFYRQAKDVAWNYLKYYAEPVIDKIMESELSVRLKNGATIRLYGADNPDSLRGVYFDGVVLDEYGNMSPRLFGEVIAPTLADRKGWVVFIGTPAGPNHFFDLWKDASADARWFTKMLKASVSGIIDAEELAMLAKLPGSDEDTFAQEFECDFNAAVRGAYWGKLINQLESTTNNFGDWPYDPDRPVHLSFDIGYSDDTSIWFYQTDGKTPRVVDFFTVSGYSAEEVLAHLQTLPYAYGTFWLPHDAKNKSFQTGKSVREQFIAAGATTRLVPELSVQDGIQAVRKTLPSVQFNTANPNVIQGLNALRVYQREWDDMRRMFREKPKHDWSSNPADSFRYMCLATNPGSAKLEKRVFTSKVPVPASNVVSLDNLYRDREASNAGPRRI